MAHKSTAAIRTILAIATLCALPAADGAPARPAAHAAAAHRPARALHRPKFRGPRGAAAQDAARFGALVGKECRGKADMPRNDHETVVLCSNGKAFVVQTPAGGTPPTECSLAGIAPLPACFTQ